MGSSFGKSLQQQANVLAAITKKMSRAAIAKTTKLSDGDLNFALMRLELKRMIRRLPKDCYEPYSYEQKLKPTIITALQFIELARETAEFESVLESMDLATDAFDEDIAVLQAYVGYKDGQSP